MLILKHPYGIDRFLDLWRRERPSFMWTPRQDSEFLRSAIGGESWTPTGGAIVGRAGIRNTTQVVTGGRMLSTPSVLGVTGATTPFMAMIAISVPIGWTGGKGHLFKIGNSTTGIGVGYGESNDDAGANGTKILLLREGIAWHASSSGALLPGLNVIAFGNTNQGTGAGVKYATVFPSVLEASTTAGMNAPSGFSYINGRNGTVSGEIRVNAVALWMDSLNDADTVVQRTRRANMWSPLFGKHPGEIDQLFAPRRIYIPTATEAATAPTLSDLRAVNIGATSTQWSVDYTF